VVAYGQYLPTVRYRCLVGCDRAAAADQPIVSDRRRPFFGMARPGICGVHVSALRDRFPLRAQPGAVRPYADSQALMSPPRDRLLPEMRLVAAIRFWLSRPLTISDHCHK